MCRTPTPHPFAQTILARGGAQMLGTGDIFLSGGWRDGAEETYEPPEDADSKLSLEELGLRALERIPRDRALNGIRAFNTMRDDLENFLRPFAQEGREVAEMDVRRFLEERAEAARIGQK